jgi:hypothetical protein
MLIYLDVLGLKKLNPSIDFKFQIGKTCRVPGNIVFFSYIQSTFLLNTTVTGYNTVTGKTEKKIRL